MTWVQLLAIVLTGVLAVAASAFGQYVGGRTAFRRDEQERAHREKERFSEPKRELYLQAIEGLSGMDELGFKKVSMAMSLSLFDAEVARKYAEVSTAHQAMFGNVDDRSKKLVAHIVGEAAAGVYGDNEAALSAAKKRGADLADNLVVGNPLADKWLEGMTDLGRLMRQSLGLPDRGPMKLSMTLHSKGKAD